MKYLLAIALLLMACDMNSGHCYYFAADYLVRGDERHWPDVGHIEDALDHIRPDWQIYVSDRIEEDWFAGRRCIVNTGRHFMAVRLSDNGYEVFDFLGASDWEAFEGPVVDFVCMDEQ